MLESPSYKHTSPNLSIDPLFQGTATRNHNLSRQIKKAPNVDQLGVLLLAVIEQLVEEFGFRRFFRSQF